MLNCFLNLKHEWHFNKREIVIRKNLLFPRFESPWKTNKDEENSIRSEKNDLIRIFINFVRRLGQIQGLN